MISTGYRSVLLAPLALLLSSILLTACENDEELIPVTGDTQMTVFVTDGPVDSATSVVVEFTGVEILHTGDTEPQSFNFLSPKTIDLLALPGNLAEPLLNDVTVKAGSYQWMRLLVNAERGVIDSYIELDDGSQHSLWIPSGSQSGLKLVSGFTVPANTGASFTIDFDLRKSVHKPEGLFSDYILRPALRLVDNTRTGAVSGTVDNSLVVTGCTPVVYLFAGADVIPDDEDGNAPDPITSAIPEINTNTGNYDYEIGFVTEGDYTIAFSCDGEADDPETSETMSFSGTQNVTVIIADTVTADFQ